MSDVFMCGCTHDHRERTHHFCSREHETRWRNSDTLRAQNAALVEALREVLNAYDTNDFTMDGGVVLPDGFEQRARAALAAPDTKERP